MNRLPSILSISLLCLSNAVLALGTEESANKTVILRIEKVGPEALGSAATSGRDSFVRVVAKAGNGKYLVVVQSNVGILRMQGAYLDSTLSVADGVFMYYHPNGRLECKGCYVAGIKTGAWLRYGLDGEQLSERIYTGRSVDEMIQRASGTPMASVPQPADRPVGAAARRQSAPMEF